MSQPPIYALLLCVVMVIAPHTEHLPAWVITSCAFLLLWRTYLTLVNSPPPKRWLLAIVTLSCTFAILGSFDTLFGRDAGVTFLILLTTLKLLELRITRDAMVLIHLCCFIVITQFFYSQDIPTALYLFATLMVIMTTWIQLQSHSITLKPRLRIAASLLVQAIPLTIILFVLFPRVQGPLWGMPQDAFARSGLDENMSPGSMSKLTLSDEVAFRVQYLDKPPKREQMYWRGPVLWDFDGNNWKPGKQTAGVRPNFGHLAQPIYYNITLEPHNKHWLFALDTPAGLSINSTFSDDFRVLSPEPVTSRIRYEAKSYLSYSANPQESLQQLQRALRFPNINPRSQQLAGSWRSKASNNQEIVNLALKFLNKQGFSYTLEPPSLAKENGIDDFLFNTKQGFCEHYASAFVFLMRAANVPARVVAGYQGGEFNAIGRYYIIRQSDAHAWAEVWLAEKGWVRIDPTAAIAPTRIQSGVSRAVPNNSALPYMTRNPPNWLVDLRLNWDAWANEWNQWVLSYDSERQFALLSNLGMESVSWQKMAINLLIGITSIVALLALFMLRHLYLDRPDTVQRAWQKLSKKFGKVGLSKAQHETANSYITRITQQYPELNSQLQDIAQHYNMLRYSSESNEQSIRDFMHKIDKLKIGKRLHKV